MKGRIMREGKNPTVLTDSEKRGCVFPHLYGVYADFPQGEGLEVENSTVLGSTERCPTELAPGEIAIISKGGASIILRNNGKVYINGREI
ncbi:MAG: hypothetical protein Q4C42_04525 [Clostridia bacterium]|nr:hypothetical protein [Clostridia bacterium]